MSRGHSGCAKVLEFFLRNRGKDTPYFGFKDRNGDCVNQKGEFEQVKVPKRKVAVSITNGVIGIFLWHNPSGRSTALGSTRPLTDMSTSNVSSG
jgi:hypothetical protein